MVARLCALAIWAVVAASAVFWGLRLGVRAPSVPANAVAVGTGAALTGDLARLLGAPPVAAPAEVVVAEASSRFKLLGVMAPKATAAEAPRNYGVALIAVDGKPAKAYAVGAALDDALVLQSVSLRSASLGPAQGATSMKLEMPALSPAATGSLPSFSVGGVPLSNAPNVMGGMGGGPPNIGARLSRQPVPVQQPNADLGQPDNFNGAATE